MTAADADNTGNTGRVYGDTSGITYATSLPIGALATLNTAADTAKDTATTGMEAKFALWKTAANTAMTAYNTMITTDTTWATVHATTGCKAATSNFGVLTLYTSADAALATATANTAARPSNLVGALSDESTELATETSCMTECKKLPSWGLKVTGTGNDEIPPVITEVCQGVETSAEGGSSAAAAWKSRCKFVSSVKKNATTVTDFILLDAGATTNTKC